jgi:hypothetical protein
VSFGRERFEAVLLLVLAVGLGVYLWTSRAQVTSAERDGRQTHVLPTFAQARIRRIAIRSGTPDQKATVLRRNAQSTDPHDYLLGEDTAESHPSPQVDRAEVAGLLKTLEFGAFVRLIAKEDLPHGVQDRPLLTLEVDMDSVSYRVTVGGEAIHPPHTRYAQTTGDDGTDRSGVVPEALVTALTKDSRELRGRLLFPYAKSQTKALRIQQGNGIRSLLADALGFRVQGRESDMRADPARVDGLFFQLARAGIEAFPNERQPSQSPVIVSQVPETGAEVRLEIGGTCPGQPELVQVVRTAPDPLVGCTSAVLLGLLEPGDLTLRGLWPLRVDEIDHIALTKRGRTMELIRDGVAFRRLSPDPGPMALDRGNQYLTDLTDFAFEPTACAGDVMGQVRVVGQPEGTSGGRELLLTLLEHEGKPLVRREDDGVCLILTDQASWLLDPDAAWYESLDVLNVPEDDIVLFRSSGPRLGREELQRTPAGLELAGARVDETLLDETLRTLAPLRALRIAPPWSSKPWQARLELRIEARSSGPFDLRIGPRVRGGFLAALAGRRTEFILSADVVRTLETSLLSRAPAQWNPDGFSELSVTAHGVTYGFRRLGGELVPTDDTPRELGPALLEALSGLTPVAAVREGAMREEAERSARLGAEEGLKLEGTYDSGDGRPRHLGIEFGAQVLHEGEPAQLMTIEGERNAYYVDRAAVLSVLDLL